MRLLSCAWPGKYTRPHLQISSSWLPHADLDADTCWLANPFPILKHIFADDQLVVQQDNPFANAGVFYIRGASSTAADGATWVLSELNSRIARFTYRPESVRDLPNTGWSQPPYFSNADDQANLNDVITSSLLSLPFYGGVEFAEARFKERFAPRACLDGRLISTHSLRDECKGVHEAKARMANRLFHLEMNQRFPDRARRLLRRRLSGRKHSSLVHLCRHQIALHLGVHERDGACLGAGARSGGVGRLESHAAAARACSPSR